MAEKGVEEQVLAMERLRSTAVFIAYKWSAKELIGGLIIQIIILIFVLSRIVRIFTLLKNKKGVPRKRRKML